MASVHHLSVSNFRGIKSLDFTIGDAKTVCLVGRGDSCKSTILEAVSYVLYPNWNLSLTDNDFYDLDTENPIIIEVTLKDVDKELLRDAKYGLYIRFLQPDGIINDEAVADSKEVLTVKLKVTKELEPKWYATSHRPNQEDLEISYSDRAMFNVFLISDYIDRHFYWGKGSPLYSLVRQQGGKMDGQVFLDLIRKLKAEVSEINFEELEGVIGKVKKAAELYGIDVSNANAGLDTRDISIKDSKITMNDNKIPFRQKGKGSRRLLSMAIQSELAKESILLIDEIEQGLEPDRIQHLVRLFQCSNQQQTFITTHSVHVVTELEVNDLFVVNRKDGIVTIDRGGTNAETHQSLVRACPEALYADKVIVCEGKTELGFCRAVDADRIRKGKKPISTYGVVYSFGDGDTFPKRAEALKVNFGKAVCVFCDSDKKLENPSKDDLRGKGIKVIDWEDGNNIEAQITKELPPEAFEKMCKYVLLLNDQNCDFAVFIKQFCSDDWNTATDARRREIFIETVKNKKWFKRIDRGEFLGGLCIEYLQSFDENACVPKVIASLNEWIEDGKPSAC